ncbi:unnamed protein product [Allacma fusca]|uniref:Autophagy-related protein 101 n=1 Tax=Allacma fusca TaxID=39272 RepID=A0A8J2JWM2_9HEXA|nr:unnamed protein product [Allacma fusca]
MNARSQTFDFSAECHQVSEVVSCIFHSILFHRTLGKFHYRQEGKYSIGTIGYEDIDCDFIDLTYVRCASSHLANTMNQHVQAFDQAIRDPSNVTENGVRRGQISLEFYNKKRVNWPFAPECLPWEVWTIRIEVKSIRSEIERQLNRENLGELVGEKVVLIAEVMNRQQYLPKIPAQSEVDLIFDTSFPDIQPYLFRMSYKTSIYPSAPNVITMSTRFFRALAF